MFLRIYARKFPATPPKGIEKCTIDSCSILFDSLDYFSSEQAIYDIDLENPNSHLKKELVETEIQFIRGGSGSRIYTIETIQHSIKYRVGGMMERELSEPFLIIRNLIKELET